MWNRDLYRKIISEIAKKGVLGNDSVKNKEALYRLLSKKIPASYDTIKSWTRPNSNGPGDDELLHNLESVLGVSLTEHPEIEVKENNDNMRVVYSDFVKENIKKAYELMIDYLHSGNVEDEETYCEMRGEMRKLKIAIPVEKKCCRTNVHLVR